MHYRSSDHEEALRSMEREAQARKVRYEKVAERLFRRELAGEVLPRWQRWLGQRAMNEAAYYTAVLSNIEAYRAEKSR